jgi:two-component system sensor histidine kinase YesM
MIGRNNGKKMSIKWKMVMAFLGVSLASLLVMAAISHIHYSRAVEKDFHTISSEATKRLSHHLDFYFRKLDQSTQSLLEKDEIQDWLTSERSYQLSELQNIEEELRRHVALNNLETMGMFLQSLDKRIISPNAGDVPSPNIFSKEPWNDEPFHQDTVILPTHSIQYQPNAGVPVLSMIIPIYSTKTLEVIGRLVLDFNLSEIESIFQQSTLGENGQFFILSKTDKVIYHPHYDWLGLSRKQTDLSYLHLENRNGAWMERHNGNKLLVSSFESGHGWNIVATVPFEDMAHGLNAARNSTLMTFAVISLCIIMAVPFLSSEFVRPVRELRNEMYKVARGDLNTRIQTRAKTFEFHQLNHSFNRMVERIKQLIDTVAEMKVKEMHLQLRQKEAMIQMLQNQINPHLLYNTLDIMKSIAFLENITKIETIAGNLADIYRYTTKYSEQEVTLREELEQLEKYIEIIHIRFPKHFQSRVYVHEKYKDCRIPKLTVQPIVENAVKYALEVKGGKGAIIVSAFAEQGDLIVEIADNGPGFSPKMMNKIQAELEHVTHGIHGEYNQNESLGLSNVHARLVLRYGKNYGLTLTSFENKGSVIGIRIPYRGIEENSFINQKMV